MLKPRTAVNKVDGPEAAANQNMKANDVSKYF